MFTLFTSPAAHTNSDECFSHHYLTQETNMMTRWFQFKYKNVCGLQDWLWRWDTRLCWKITHFSRSSQEFKHISNLKNMSIKIKPFPNCLDSVEPWVRHQDSRDTSQSEDVFLFQSFWVSPEWNKTKEELNQNAEDCNCNFCLQSLLMRTISSSVSPSPVLCFLVWTC